MTASGMQSFWYDIAWALPSAIKALLLLTSSTALNFGDPGVLNFPMQAYILLYFCALPLFSTPAPKCSIAFAECDGQQSAQFCLEGLPREHDYMCLSESGILSFKGVLCDGQ